MTEFKNLEIPEQEKSNLTKFLASLREKGKEKGLDVVTEVVGGVLNKPWPRKDIDVTVRLGKKGKGDTAIERACDEFKTLSELVEETIAGGDFKVIKKIKPAIDEEFDSPNILKFDGTIQVKPEKGAVIELIRRE